MVTGKGELGYQKGYQKAHTLHNFMVKHFATLMQHRAVTTTLNPAPSPTLTPPPGVRRCELGADRRAPGRRD